MSYELRRGGFMLGILIVLTMLNKTHPPPMNHKLITPFPLFPNPYPLFPNP